MELIPDLEQKSILYDGANVQADLLGQYSCVLIDLPGHGESEVAEAELTIEYMARAVESVLQHEGVEQAVIVGHSMGGPVATMLLRLHSNRVSAIIYVDSFFDLPENYVNQKQRKAWRESLMDDQEFRDTIRRRFLTDRMTETVKERILQVTTETSKYVRLHSVTTDKLPHAWRHDEVYDIPALLLVTPVYADIDRRWLQHMPGLQVENWNDHGHFLFMEEPVVFNSRVKNFMKQM
ncbi:hypothetical protein LTS14_006680 [Recurvomyces mirabilis]|uniref:uncharacterized protein n=1 Tax=Recurvomyces mirabilis TaxID=574656 RepID=UPI002DDF96EC|nr:hypothetical protein LTS14_006680 [Recurvomyces mirabilis]